MRWPRPLVLPALCLFAVAAGESPAQTPRGGSGGASAELLQQMQQLASERTSLQAENARMKKQLDDATRERDALKNAQKSGEARLRQSAAALAQADAQKQSSEDELKRTKERMQELVDRFRQTLTQLHDIESDRTATKEALRKSEQEVKVCIDRNVKLYQLNDEILTHWDKQSFSARLASAEPFTRIERTRNENLIDDYKSRADDLRLTPDSLKAAAARPPPPRPAEAPAAAPPQPQEAPPSAPKE